MTTQQRTPMAETGIDKAIVAGTRWLADHSIDILRIGLGAVIFAFGVLKFFPGVSPAEGLVEATVGELTLGLVDGRMAIVTTAVIEVALGLALITGRFLKATMVIFAGWIAGVMAPLVLFFDELFTHGGPTLEAQYVIKDVVFLAAGMVVAAKALGARMVADDDEVTRR